VANPWSSAKAPHYRADISVHQLRYPSQFYYSRKDALTSSLLKSDHDTLVYYRDMNQSLLESAQTILKKTIYSTLATSAADGSPWAAPMFTVYNPETKSVYWCAARDSQHAQNIRHNGAIFITVYDSMAAPGEGAGIYLKATAAEVTEPQAIAEAHAMLIAKHQAPYWKLDDLQAPSPIALYEAKVEEAWVNQDREEDGHFVLYRHPITL